MISEDERNPSVKDDETSRDPSAKCSHGPVCRTLQNAAQDEKRNNGERCVRQCIFDSRDPTHIKYHQTRPPDSILIAQSKTEPRLFLGIRYRGCLEKNEFFMF